MLYLDVAGGQVNRFFQPEEVNPGGRGDFLQACLWAETSHSGTMPGGDRSVGIHGGGNARRDGVRNGLVYNVQPVRSEGK